MKQLWAPWRIDFILSDKEEGCFLCNAPKSEDSEDNLILFRGKSAFVIMNKYPYNSGHVMVAPYAHVSDISMLEDKEEIMILIEKSINVIKSVMNPEGFNIGVNLGKCAGAGVEDHIHFHIVPRWCGDTNFMPIFADVKVIPEHLRATYRKLREGFKL